MSSALSTQNSTIAIGNGASPEVFTAIGEVKGIDGPGGGAAVIDVTHLGSSRREKRKGIPDGGQVTITANRVFGNAGQVAMIAAEASPDPYNFKITYPNTETVIFEALVMEFREGSQVDGVVELSMTLEVTGEITRSAEV